VYPGGVHKFIGRGELGQCGVVERIVWLRQLGCGEGKRDGKEQSAFTRGRRVGRVSLQFAYII
jgi:hypothetical protein